MSGLMDVIQGLPQFACFFLMIVVSIFVLQDLKRMRRQGLREWLRPGRRVERHTEGRDTR